MSVGVTSAMNWCWNSSVTGIADEREVGVRLERPEDVVEDRVGVGLLEVAALLDIGVLVDDPRLERREVGRDEVGKFSARYFSSLFSPAPPAARCTPRSRRSR